MTFESYYQEGPGRNLRVLMTDEPMVIYGYPNNISVAINIKKKKILYFEQDNSVIQVDNEPAKRADHEHWREICGRDENMLFQKALKDYKNENIGSCLLL